MNLKENLAMQFGLVYRMVADNAGGMTAAQSLARSDAGGNCANWVLGHLTNVQNGVMRLVGESPVWESEQLARAGWDPITGQSNAIDWDTLRERFLGSRDRCVAAIAALSEESLNEQVPHPFEGTTSRAELLGILSFHQAYHSGQLGIVRRIAGLEGVVKGPGQPKEARAAGR
jgi:uncharacterized damage-inducible protein DinB